MLFYIMNAHKNPACDKCTVQTELALYPGLQYMQYYANILPIMLTYGAEQYASYYLNTQTFDNPIHVNRSDERELSIRKCLNSYNNQNLPQINV